MWAFLMRIDLPLFSFSLWQLSAGVWQLDSCFFPHSYTALCWKHYLYKFKYTGTLWGKQWQHGVSVAVSYSWQSTQHRANWTMSECYCCVGGWKWDWRLVLQANIKHLGSYPLSILSVIWGRDLKSFQCKTWIDESKVIHTLPDLQCIPY